MLGDFEQRVRLYAVQIMMSARQIPDKRGKMSHVFERE